MHHKGLYYISFHLFKDLIPFNLMYILSIEVVIYVLFLR